MTLKEMSQKLNRPLSEFQYRADGRMEWVCEHGVGHTVWVPEFLSSDSSFGYIHGCDGCCCQLDERKEQL